MKSIADEVKEILELSSRPKSMKEIVCALNYKYDSGQVSVSINYWVKRGSVKSELKEGYSRNKVYSLARAKK